MSVAGVGESDAKIEEMGGLAGVLAADEFKLEAGGVYARRADEFGATTNAEASETPEGWASR